jgi:hypothetical protein
MTLPTMEYNRRRGLFWTQMGYGGKDMVKQGRTKKQWLLVFLCAYHQVGVLNLIH